MQYVCGNSGVVSVSNKMIREGRRKYKIMTRQRFKEGFKEERFYNKQMTDDEHLNLILMNVYRLGYFLD